MLETRSLACEIRPIGHEMWSTGDMRGRTGREWRSTGPERGSPRGDVLTSFAKIVVSPARGAYRSARWFPRAARQSGEMAEWPKATVC